MLNRLLIILVGVALVRSVNGQEAEMLTLREVNNTGVPLVVYMTHHFSDSTKADGLQRCPVGGTGGIDVHPTLMRIRMDYIVVDDNTKDTLSSISVIGKDLYNGVISFEKGVNTLKPPYEVEPRLRIRSTGYKNTVRVGEPIEIRLITKEKIIGYVFSYNLNLITILTENKQKVEIVPENIKGIRSICWSSYYDNGGKVEDLKQCKLRKLSTSKFEFVEQRYNDIKRNWEWVKIP
jgi:hypothetical protein